MMSTAPSTAADSAAGDLDAVEAILRRGGEGLRRRMVRAECHLQQVTAGAGAPLATHANATVVAGGKRLRPLLVMLAAESAGAGEALIDTPAVEERLVRAAVAVELVHSAIATGDLLFSRAFAELARNDDPAQLRALSDASSALAAGELLQREDAYASHVAVERYLRRCELKTAALFEAACRLGALVAVEGSASEIADALGAFARRIGLRADRGHRRARRGPGAGARGGRRGQGGATGEPARRPHYPARPGRRRGRRALPVMP